MNRILEIKTSNIILIGGILLVSGIGLGFLVGLLIPQILVVLGIELLILGGIKDYVFKRSSIRNLGFVLLIFSMLNFLRHSTFFIVISQIGRLFEHDSYFLFFLAREIVWLLVSLWILSRGLLVAKRKNKLNFEAYIKSREFKFLSISILILLALEIPVFGIHHGGFGGGLHGHGFWELGLHFH